MSTSLYCPLILDEEMDAWMRGTHIEIKVQIRNVRVEQTGAGRRRRRSLFTSQNEPISFDSSWSGSAGLGSE